MIKFIHGADFHLDSPFRSLPSHKAAERRAEQRGLLSRFAELVREREADLVLLSGDLLDGGNIYYETAQALARALGQLQARVFIAPGNHDPYTPRSPYATIQWPGNVHIFSQSAAEAVELPELGCVVYGSAFTGPSREEGPLKTFKAPRDGRVHIMCVHGDMGVKNSVYGPVDRLEIAGSGLDYLALGHIHARTSPEKLGATTWAYPGCPEGRGFDETGEKGVLYGEVEGGRVRLEFVPICRRRYGILQIDAASDFEAALPRDAGEDIYRIILTGESGARGVSLRPLEDIAERYFYSVTLRDETKISRDLWSRADEDTLTGIFLRRMADRRAAAKDEKGRALAERAARFGLAALEKGEDCCP